LSLGTAPIFDAREIRFGFERVKERSF